MRNLARDLQPLALRFRHLGNMPRFSQTGGFSLSVAQTAKLTTIKRCDERDQNGFAESIGYAQSDAHTIRSAFIQVSLQVVLGYALRRAYRRQCRTDMSRGRGFSAWPEGPKSAMSR